MRFYLEVLSIDICVGVLGTGALTQTMFSAEMKPIWWVLLPVCVWVVYTLDHLIDALKGGGNSANPRHQFHYEHIRLMTVLAILVGMSAFVMAIIFLREVLILSGLILGILTLVHLFLAYWGKIRFGKELSVGLIYVSGVAFAPILNRRVTMGWFEMLFLLGLLLAAYLNLFMNSIIEYSIDRRDGQNFIVSRVSRLWLRRKVTLVSNLAALFFMCVCIVSIIFSRPIGQTVAWAILAIYCVVPGLLLKYETKLTSKSAYRLYGEWVFSIGLLTLLLPNA